VAQFRYSGMTATNQNLIRVEIKRRLNSHNACYHSVQKLLSSCLLPKNRKIRIYKAVILHVVLYGCQPWCQIFTTCILLCVTNMWQGKASSNTTDMVLLSVDTQIESYFLPLHVSVLMGPSSGGIMIIQHNSEILLCVC
jgi:hypothetical protein